MLLLTVSGIAGFLVGRAAFADVSDAPPSTYPYIGMAAVAFIPTKRGWLAIYVLSAVAFVLFCALGAVSGGVGGETSVPRYGTYSRRAA